MLRPICRSALLILMTRVVTESPTLSTSLDLFDMPYTDLADMHEAIDIDVIVQFNECAKI